MEIVAEFSVPQEFRLSQAETDTLNETAWGKVMTAKRDVWVKS